MCSQKKVTPAARRSTAAYLTTQHGFSQRRACRPNPARALDGTLSIAPREILSLTVGFDHGVVDGAPAARFVRRLVQLIESGYGLAALLLVVSLVDSEETCGWSCQIPCGRRERHRSARVNALMLMRVRLQEEFALAVAQEIHRHASVLLYALFHTSLLFRL